MPLIRSFLLMSLVSGLLSSAELKGYISDAACGWNNARSTPEAKECALKCVKAGWDPVFVLDGKMDVYKIADKNKVMALVGEHVAITGAITKDAVSIRSVRKLAK
ncbi:MAG: hypothetical protein SGI92_01365 [Bryobacteraceae bacterium]|nr:hypothetical protein [Bryobacteraceae bacterium]